MMADCLIFENVSRKTLAFVDRCLRFLSFRREFSRDPAVWYLKATTYEHYTADHAVNAASRSLKKQEFFPEACAFVVFQ